MGRNKNYTFFSKKDKSVVDNIPENKELNEAKKEEDKEKVVEEPIIKETVIGKVAGCNRLNLRSEASLNSDVITVLEEGAEVIIDDEDISGTEFYHVKVDGKIGYCLMKFISIE